MPNLCRRKRNITNNMVNLSADMIENVSYMRSFLNKSNTETRNEQITATVVTQQQTYPLNLPLTRNLGAELDDDTHVVQLKKKESQTSSTSSYRAFSTKNFNIDLNGSSKGTESTDTTSRTTPTPTGSNIFYSVGRKKKCISFWSCLFLFALFLPALLFSLSPIKQNEHLFKKINNNYLKPHFGLGVDNKAEEVDLIQIQPGNCWTFKGSKGDLFIKLATLIRPTGFSIEHIEFTPIARLAVHHKILTFT